MSSRNRSGRTRGALVLAAVVVVSGLAGLVATGTAAAAPVSLTLNYQCVFPLLGPQPVVVKLTSDVPDSVVVGEQMPGFVVDSVSTVNAASTRGLVALYSATLEGNALAQATLLVPEEPNGLPVEVDSLLEKTTLPPEGEFTVKGKGTSPDLTFSQAGPGKVTVGDLVLTLTPRTADGGETGLGPFESECIQDPGQNNVLAEFTITEKGAQGPSKPGVPTVTGKTSTSVSLIWGPSTAPGGTVTGYEVHSGGAAVATSTGTGATVENLTPGTAYTFTVKAKDSAGKVSEPSDPVTVTTELGGPSSLAFSLKGTSAVKAGGWSVPLTGAVTAEVAPGTGDVTADLALDPAKGNLQILGFLPVTADVVYAAQGGTTGKYAGGVLSTASKMIIRLPAFNAFGVVPVGGGEKCRAKEPADIALKSSGAFDPKTGGPLKGTYDLSALTDCGPLTGLLSSLTAGPGNTVDLTLTPKSQS